MSDEPALGAGRSVTPAHSALSSGSDRPASDAADPSSQFPTVSSTRDLLGASFDLVLRSADDMRRASFYIGAIVLGTLGPLALMGFALEVFSPGIPLIVFEPGIDPTVDPTFARASVPFALLIFVAAGGLVVATVESRTMAAAVLGARLIGRPITTRRALARARRCFWRSVVATIAVAVPIGIAQRVVDGVLDSIPVPTTETSLVSSTLVTAFVGAPFAYALAGVVLGDVGAWEAIRRSIRVFRARKRAAAVVAGFESVAALLLFFGLSAGLDLVLRLMATLGLSPTSDGPGLAIVSAAIVAGVFAFGTLLYTVYAITVAPQVVMFISLTHATMGVERVRVGGPDDPNVARAGGSRFRWLTRPMLLGFLVGGVALVAVLAVYLG